MSNAQEKAFRRYLAELVRFLALPRRVQEATGTADKVYARLRRYALRAGDSDSYLFGSPAPSPTMAVTGAREASRI